MGSTPTWSAKHDTLRTMSLIDKITKYGWQQGFGCVVLDDATRLHLWSPMWPDTAPQFIHSHSYHFRSTVLVGEMIAPEYRVEINPEGEGSLIVGTVTDDKLQNPTKCDVISVGEINVKAGETYEFGGIDRFHSTGCDRLVMTHFEVLPIPAVKGSGFILPLAKFKKFMTKPTPDELRTEVIRLLEENNL